jgi:hypothetical protein
MSDALMGLTEINDASQASIANLVQSFLIQESKMLGKVLDYSNLAVAGTKSIALPRSGGFSVGTKGENSQADATTVTYASDVLSLNKHKYVQFLIEKIAQVQAMPEVVSDMLMKAAKALALDVDTEIIAAMVAGASASNPDHQIVFIDTTNDVIAKGDVLAARKLLQGQYIDPMECYIGVGPEKENELLNLSEFISANEYGAGAPLASGVIGKIYGMNVLVHTGFADRMVTWHPSSVAYAQQAAVAVDSQKDLANIATRYGLDHLYGVKVLDSGKRLVHTDSTN